MEEAQRHLEGASERATQARQNAMQAAVSELADRAGELHETQREMERLMQEEVRGAMDNDAPPDAGLSWQEEIELAEDKRELLAELQALQRDAVAAAGEFGKDNPDIADQLRDSFDKIKEMEIDARIAVAALYIEQGDALFVASSESAVTESLRQLREDLRQAERMAGTALNGEPGDGERMQAALAEARELRRALQQAAAGQGEGAAGMPVGGPDDPDRERTSGATVPDLEIGEQLNRQAEDVAQNVTELLRAASNAGASRQDVDELRRLAASIRASDFSGNPDVLAREAREALVLAEQLELQLASVANGANRGIRGDINADVPEQHREIVADYYRRLGQAESED
jgi:hypothetical protein